MERNKWLIPLIIIIAVLIYNSNKEAPKQAGCVIPTEGMHITEDTTFCSGEYVLDDTANSGVIIVSNIKTPLTITCDNTILTGKTQEASRAIYIWHSNNITVQGCTLKNFRMGIYSSNSNELILQQNHFTDNNFSIYNDVSADITIKDNIFNDAYAYNIYGYKSNNYTIENNNADSASINYQIIPTDPSLKFLNNIFVWMDGTDSNLTISNNIIHNQRTITSADNMSFIGNTITTDFFQPLMHFQGTLNNVAYSFNAGEVESWFYGKNLLISNNIWNGNGFAAIKSASSVEYSYNKHSNNVQYFGRGVTLGSNSINVTITHNTFDHVPRPIVVSSSTAVNTVISYNSINHYDMGIRLDGARDTILHDNTYKDSTFDFDGYGVAINLFYNPIGVEIYNENINYGHMGIMSLGSIDVNIHNIYCDQDSLEQKMSPEYGTNKANDILYQYHGTKNARLDHYEPTACIGALQIYKGWTSDSREYNINTIQDMKKYKSYNWQVNDITYNQDVQTILRAQGLDGLTTNVKGWTWEFQGPTFFVEDEIFYNNPAWDKLYIVPNNPGFAGYADSWQDYFVGASDVMVRDFDHNCLGYTYPQKYKFFNYTLSKTKATFIYSDEQNKDFMIAQPVTYYYVGSKRYCTMMGTTADDIYTIVLPHLALPNEIKVNDVIVAINTSLYSFNIEPGMKVDVYRQDTTLTTTGSTTTTLTTTPKQTQNISVVTWIILGAAALIFIWYKNLK